MATLTAQELLEALNDLAVDHCLNDIEVHIEGEIAERVSLLEVVGMICPPGRAPKTYKVLAIETGVEDDE